MLTGILRLSVVGCLLLALPWVQAEPMTEAESAFGAGNYQKALSIWTESAEQGDVSAQVRLASLYAKGLGVERNRPEALKWLNKAVEQDSVEAMFRLGQLYETRYGDVLGDEGLSFKWYMSAAERGHAGAQYAIGVKYFKGQGVSTDYVSAYAWMDLAAKTGDPSVIGYRDLIGGVLSSEDLEKARESAEALSVRLETR